MFNINNYYKIGEMMCKYGLLELFESKKWGDEVPSVVTLDGVKHGETFDSLRVYYNDNF